MALIIWPSRMVLPPQECLDVPLLAKEAVSALGGPARWVGHSDAIGSGLTALGYHGYIGVVVLARMAHVNTGRFGLLQVIPRHAGSSTKPPSHERRRTRHRIASPAVRQQLHPYIAIGPWPSGESCTAVCCALIVARACRSGWAAGRRPCRWARSSEGSAAPGTRRGRTRSPLTACTCTESLAACTPNLTAAS